jgi:tRNA nucleotidyltransferase (CCA-adding enzyme)
MSYFSDLPVPQRRAIEILRDVAAEKACRPFLVGGPVRDLLIGRHAIDIDLTLEDGSSTLARALARKIEGRVRSYPQFLTYKVTADGFPEIDIATARSERYRSPGALPSVAAGRLKDDLLRRDFAMNALALDLLDETLHDPAGGKRDLEQRQVRVLHERSFIDDPTRIFRAIRLAVRLSFELEPETAELMNQAIASDALATVSKERLWRELFLAMEEERAPEVLTELAMRGALDHLFSRRRDDSLHERLSRLQPLLAEDQELDRFILFTGALLRGDGSPIDLEGSGFSQKKARAVVEIANEIDRIADTIRSAGDDHSRFKACRRVSREALGATSVVHPDVKPIVDRYREFEEFSIPLRGNELDVPPGPHVAKALEAAREAVFSGEIPADDARRYAQEIARKLGSG